MALGRNAMRGWAVVVSLLFLVSAAPARAAETVAFAPGPEFSLRLGPSFVAGEARDGQPLAKQVGAPLAFIVDGGYRATPYFYLGGLWAMGFGLVDPRPCPVTFGCDAPGLVSNIGVNGRFHFLPESVVDPWVGAGVALSIEGYSGSRTERRDGFCLFGSCSDVVKMNTLRFGGSLLLEGGVDYRVSRKVGVGVGAAGFAGKFLTEDTTFRVRQDEVPGGSGGAVDGGYHLWVLFTGRVVLNVL